LRHEPLHTGGPRGGRAEQSTAERQEERLITLPEAPRRTSERYPAATGPMAEAAERGLRHLLEVSGLELSFRIHQGEGRLEIELSGSDAELCSSEEGELLRAIEHLLPRLIRTLAGEPIPCRVDCDNFHEIWEERLRSLAQRVADEVRRHGRPRTLEPMNPADRRIVHMTLADDPAVETESEGEGYFKRITIRPT
jgi:spoIIIJ-associated protein